MNSRFEHSERANYLILGTEQKEERMADHMLLQNEIRGLLPVRMERMNGCKEYYYDITSKHSLGSIVKKGSLNVQKIRLLIRAIGELLEQFHEYMLEPDGICLSEELIYTTLPEWKLSFCYFEDGEGRFTENLRKLLQFAIEYVDYQDREAVALAYACFQASMRENFTFAEIERCLAQKEEPEHGEDFSTIRLVAEPQIQSEIMEEEAEESTFDKKKARKISCCVIGAGVLLTGFLELAAIEGVFGEISPIFLLIAGAVFTLIAFLIWSIVKRRWMEQTRLVTKEVEYPFDRKTMEKVSETDRRQKEAENTRNGYGKNGYNKDVRNRDENNRDENNRDANDKDANNEDMNNKDADKREENYGKTILLAYCAEQEHRTLISCQKEYPSIEITEYPFSIGKISSLNQAVILHEGISRIHCSIQKGGQGYTITDRNSTNGVIVNGIRLMPNETKELPTGSEVMLGILRYIFR